MQRSGAGSPLPGDLAISIHLNPDNANDLRGFGLQVRDDRYPAGFGWEWFNCGEDGEYSKLQLGGKVKVTFQQGAPFPNEPARIDFLTDITLRFCRPGMSCRGDDRSHTVVIKAGSVLDFGPSVLGTAPVSTDPDARLTA